MRQTKRTWMICYDIADPRRLQRVHRIIRRQAIAVQYSVFVAPFTDQEVDALLQLVKAEIDPTEDDVRAYPIKADGAVAWGPDWIGEEMYLMPFPLQGGLAPREGDGEKPEHLQNGTTLAE